MENSEVIWCSSSYIRKDDVDFDTETKSNTGESILETEYRVLSTEDLGEIPLSGNEKVFAEQHLWNIPIDLKNFSKPFNYKENVVKTTYLDSENKEDTSLFFNNWGKLGRIILFWYITFLSILQDITGVVIPNSLYKSELSDCNIQVVTETPCISPLYPIYWKYILEPARYFISIFVYIIWKIELSSKDEFENKIKHKKKMSYQEEMTWMPGTLNLVVPINYQNNSNATISIFSRPLENIMRNCKGLRTLTREYKIINNVCKDRNNKIKFVAIRPIGNVIVIGYSNSFSVWEYRVSLLNNVGVNYLNTINNNFRNSSDILNLNGKWNYIYSIDLFKLNCLTWSSDGAVIYAGDGSSIRKFSYIYLITQDSKKLGYNMNSEAFINNGKVVARGPTIAHDCISIATSKTFSIIGTIWEGGYFRIYDTVNWDYFTVCHKFSSNIKTFLPKVTCIDNRVDNHLSSFIFADSESIYELLLSDQKISKIKETKLLHPKNHSEEFDGIRLRELPIHSRNREKSILNFSATFQRIAVTYKESNLVWLYCYLMNSNKNSKLMLIGVIRDLGIPFQLSMQTINESDHLVSGTLLSIKWKLKDQSRKIDEDIEESEDSLYNIKTYPLFHYLQ